jgi:hypothetical protein
MSKIGEIALNLIYVRDQLKVYHWSTTNYARHIASDNLVNNLTLKMDQFMEVIQGAENKRLILKKSTEFNISVETDKSVVNLLNKFKIWLTDILPTYIKKNNTDLFNIRDDILSDVNNTLYLFTLS